MASCGVLSGGGGGTASKCPSGQTCCTMFAIQPSAACAPPDLCRSFERVHGPRRLASGQVCCAGSADGGLDAGDGRIGGGRQRGIPMIDPSMFGTTCQASCTATQTQYCTTDTDCPSVETCRVVAHTALVGAFITLPSSCAAPRPDAGVTTPDSGSTGDDTGSTAEAGSADATQE